MRAPRRARLRRPPRAASAFSVLAATGQPGLHPVQGCNQAGIVGAPAPAKPPIAPTRSRLCPAAVVGDSIRWRSTKAEIHGAASVTRRARQRLREQSCGAVFFCFGRAPAQTTAGEFFYAQASSAAHRKRGLCPPSEAGVQTARMR